jgi:hypothetical protein
MSINSGNACYIHHWCMASVILSSLIGFNGVLSPGSCKLPPSLAMQRLNELAQLYMKESDGSQECRLAIAHIGRVKKLTKAILNKTLSTHVHKSAFDGINFGANPHGILSVTMDDHLHSCEAGIMMNLAEVAYHGLTACKGTNQG